VKHDKLELQSHLLYSTMVIKYSLLTNMELIWRWIHYSFYWAAGEPLEPKTNTSL